MLRIKLMILEKVLAVIDFIILIWPFLSIFLIGMFLMWSVYNLGSASNDCLRHGYPGYKISLGETYCIRRSEGTDHVVRLSDLEE